jgi:hypothetical protein
MPIAVEGGLTNGLCGELRECRAAALGHFLGECVESVLNQSGVSVRVLTIDDPHRTMRHKCRPRSSTEARGDSPRYARLPRSTYLSYELFEKRFLRLKRLFGKANEPTGERPAAVDASGP